MPVQFENEGTCPGIKAGGVLNVVIATLPAIVLATAKGEATVVLAGGQQITLNAESSRWTGRTPGALLKRGDLVRLRRIETARKPAQAAPAPTGTASAATPATPPADVIGTTRGLVSATARAGPGVRRQTPRSVAAAAGTAFLVLLIRLIRR